MMQMQLVQVKRRYVTTDMGDCEAQYIELRPNETVDDPTVSVVTVMFDTVTGKYYEMKEITVGE